MVNGIISADTIGYKPIQKGTSATAVDIGNSFSQFLDDAVHKLEKQQQDVDTLNTSYIRGDAVDVHQMMVAAEKASLGVELTVQVRNKAIEAYQDIMRMQF